MKSATLVRRIRARPSIVFEALATLEGLTSWWGPDDMPVVAAAADIRVGGEFRVRFRTADGLEHECAGTFLDIREGERVIMSWCWTHGGAPEEKGRTSRVELHLKSIAEDTELTLIHTELLNEVSANSHSWGWNGALEKLMRDFTRKQAG